MKLSNAITKDELRALSQPSDVRAAIDLVAHLGVLAIAFAIPAIWTNPATILLAILLMGGRMQASGVIHHDCAHGAFFKTKWANELVGHWLTGGAINSSLPLYREYHLRHHRYAGTPDDPDKWMVANYPIDQASLKRKFLRDVTGRTAIRDLARDIKGFTWGRSAPWVVFNAGLIAALAGAGILWTYVLWWAARLFVYPAIHRLRQIAEHGIAADRDDPDPRRNTATTRASWWERLFIAPANVHYHLEHHMFAAIPPYRLAETHRLLKARGFYGEHDCIADGYLDVISRAVRPAAGSAV